MSVPSLLAHTVKNLPAMWVDLGSTPGLGRSPEERNGYPLQYSCLVNSMDRGYSPWGCKRVRHNLVTQKQLYLLEYIIAFVSLQIKSEVEPLGKGAWYADRDSISVFTDSLWTSKLRILTLLVPCGTLSP